MSMFQRIIKKMLTAQIFSAVTVMMCLVIDNMFIGRFLKEEALAAYGLATPLLLVISATAMLLSAGSQVVCSRSIGRGLPEETNRGYSSAVAASGAVAVLYLLILLLFRSPLTSFLGAGSEGNLFDMTRGYLLGFGIGIPGILAALVLVPFLQMAGESTLLVISVLSMTAADIVFDALNVLVFHGGMFGMGLASSLSYYVAVVIGIRYFFSKRCAFRFSFDRVSLKIILDILKSGIPTGVSMLNTVVLIFLINRILNGLGSTNGISAFAEIVTIGGLCNCVSTGVNGVNLTLSGILYHEEDRAGLHNLSVIMIRYGVMIAAAVAVILEIIAPFFVSLFIPAPGEAQDMAITGLRMIAPALPLCTLNNVPKSAYQGMEHPVLACVFSTVEVTVIPVLAAFLFSRAMGVTGVWLYFLSGEVLIIPLLILYIRLRTGKMPWRDDAILLLKDDFGPARGDLLEADLHDMQEVLAFSQKAKNFCLNHSQSKLTSSRIALCIEEMAGNTVQHGFTKDSKAHGQSVRLLRKPDMWVLRFRDDCRAFDPIHYIPAEGKDALGIRLVLGMATQVNYTHTLNMNNLIIKLPVDGEASGPAAESSDC